MDLGTASSTVTRPDDPPERRATTNGRLRDVGVVGRRAPPRTFLLAELAKERPT